MSTDHDADYGIDARLQQAGRSWRDANDAVAKVDFAMATTTRLASAEPTEVPLMPESLKAPRRHARVWIGAVAGLVAAVLAALIVARAADKPTNRQPATDAPKLIGTNWTLVAMKDSAGKSQPVVTAAALQFDGKTIGGNDGCNGFGAQATVSGDHILIGEVTGTLIGCINREPGFAGEVTLIGAVLDHGAVNWSTSNGSLTLTKDGVGSLTYVPVPTSRPSTDPRALINIFWSLKTLRDSGGPSTSISGSGLQIVSGGGFTVDHLCYQRKGVANLGDGTADFTHVVSYPHSCPPPSDDASAEATEEGLIDAVLVGPTTWSITGDQLTITKAGVGSLVFERKDVDPGFTGSSAPGLPSATSTK